ncbi:phage tail terminator-like protein [Chitinolyticbacter meiyuanensis]|uniref:phage tail terminator-like protein n=1 Tax=Chitinolyticbacter meiyuanensis TaxID=682798 RepID=UPI0016527333|nr:phage tail terminator-like protein [Chitinolyticbacter meiyuanensis]
MIRKILETRLSAIPGAPPIAWEGKAFATTQGLFWEVFLLPAAPDNPALDVDYRRERGVLQVTINAESGKGPKAAQDSAETIRAAFARGLDITDGPVRLIVERSPANAPAIIEDGRYRLPVSISYTADVFG